MARVADVRLSWIRSPSADVTARRIRVTKNGEETVYDVGPEVAEYAIEVPASSSVTFRTEVLDSEGNVATSEVASFSVGDLESPLPDTGLFHEIVGVRDVPENPTPNPPDGGGTGEGGTPPQTSRRGRHSGS